MLNWTLASEKNLTVVDDNGNLHTTTNTNPNWEKILEALRADRGDEVIRLISTANAVVDFFEGKVAVKDGQVWYVNQVLHGLDVDRVLGLMKMSLPVQPMVRFLDNKMRNPSRRAINELYTFLEHKQMPITPNGTVLGWKGVRSDFYSVHGNPATVVLQGTVNEAGCILNEIGATIEVARNSVCDDFEVGCGEGLHVGSREYAEGWAGADGKVVLVEFSPEDAVSVPKDCNFQKLRVSKYIVRSECTRDTKLNDVYTDEHTLSQYEDGECDPDGKGYPGYEDGECDPDCSGCDCGKYEDEDEDLFTPPPTDQLQGKEDDGNDGTFIDEYDKGYNEGLKDGRGHKARQFRSDDDVPFGYTQKFVSGYCDGYWNARHANDDCEVESD